jgi:hypothetical protein
LGSGDHFSGKSFSRETPVCSGPRQWDQSPANDVETTENTRHTEKKNLSQGIDLGKDWRESIRMVWSPVG